MVDLLDQLVACCVDVLGVTAAGLLLDDQRGNLVVIASSSEETRLLEVLQLQNDEGPCLDCVRSGAVVTCPDLTVASSSWPQFAAAALAAGIQAVDAVPMRLRAQTIGALNLFLDRPQSLGESDRSVAQALADVATIGILQRRSAHRTAEVAEQLQHALNSRVIIEQAKGILAERFQLSMDGAFEAMRQQARRHNHKLTDVALGVVRGEVDLPGLAVPGTRRGSVQH